MQVKCRGFTLVELLVGMAISTIAIAGIYSTYVVVRSQYERVDAKLELHNSGRAAIQLISRDLRMAGYEHRNDKGVLVYGPIGQQALTIAASGQEISVVYDYEVPRLIDSIERRKITYKAEAFLNKYGARYRLKKTVEVLQPTYRKSENLFIDYIDDLKFYKSDNVINIELLLRSKNESSSPKKFTRKSYYVTGKDVEDAYEREVFSTSILPRNNQ